MSCWHNCCDGMTMPRKILIRHSELPYHIYNRTIDKEFYPLDKTLVWSIYRKALWDLKNRYSIKIYAFVLMSNHYHLIVSTPKGNIDDVMRDLQSRVSNKFSKIIGLQKYKFSTRYKWSLIGEARHFWSVFRYVYQNPVRANMSRTPQSYPWSSYIEYFRDFGARTIVSPLEDLTCLGLNSGEIDSIVNDQIREQELIKIKRGLKRKIYTEPVRLRVRQTG